MTRKVWDILKIRWPELVMLVGLYAGISILSRQLMLQFEQLDANGSQMPLWTSFLLGMGFMAIGIVLQIQIWGFLRSIAIDPAAPHRPMDLLRVGVPYLWRLIGFQFLFAVLLLFVSIVLLTLLGILFFRQPVIWLLPPWLYVLSSFLGFLLLVKPFILMPALVLIYAYSLRESFFTLHRFELLRMPRFILVFAVGLAIASPLMTAIGSLVQQARLAWIVWGLEGLITSSLMIGIYLTAILCITGNGAKSTEVEVEEVL